MKRIFLLLYGLLYFQMVSQDNRWVDMFSYLNVSQTQITGDKLIAQSETAFFMWDKNTSEISTLSSINGLSGDIISGFYYHEQLQKLFIFHQGGLIETVDKNNNVFKSPYLFNNTFIPLEDKKLNGIAVNGNILYLATGYGVSEYNLEKNEFGDTFYVDNGANYVNVNDIAIFDNKIFIALQTGIKYAAINDNLIDFNVWHNLTGGQWNKLTLFNGKLYGAKHNELHEISLNGTQLIINYPQNIISLKSNDYLDVCLAQDAYVYTGNLVEKQHYTIQNYPDDTFTEINDDNDIIYLSTKQHGVLQTDINQQQFEEIHPDCPLLNHAFAVDARQGKLWLAYGDHFEFNPWPLSRYGLSSYQDGKWINFSFDQINTRDISFIKINPNNIDEVYFSGVSSGLLRIRNNQIDRLFNYQNSPLDEVGNGETRVFALDFDSKNNLWVTQKGHPALFKLSPNDSWTGINLSGVLTDTDDYIGFGTLSVDKDDNVWIGSIYKGVLGYNPETHQVIANNKGIEPYGYSYILGMAIDKDNTMWIGNHEGLRIMNQPQDMFTQNDKEFKPVKIVYEDAVQLLMDGQKITDIEVDGANNKWIATLGSGAYYFNEDGQQTIYHFTKENSPLPSDEIYDIAIDGSNGRVYFATLNGLVAFKGIATESGENMDDVYAFPNPVNQKQHDFVTIRGLIEGVVVKIVDVEGNLVYETVSRGGSINWDLTAFGKYKVASGVYIALITNEEGTKTQTTKILVIK
jgi:hypothetical protein